MAGLGLEDAWKEPYAPKPGEGGHLVASPLTATSSPARQEAGVWGEDAAAIAGNGH